MRRLTFATGLAFAATMSCGTVDLGPTPADINTCRPSQAFFAATVWPELLNKNYGGKTCGDSGCHGITSGRAFIVVAPTSMVTEPLPDDWMQVYRSTTSQLQCTDVAQSILLKKIDGRQSHFGGKLVEPDGPESVLLRMWVQAK